MHVLVIYESMFGNTLEVARAIADGISDRMPVELVEVSSAPTVIPDDVALVVIGGPTHAHGMSKADSRADSARRAGDGLVSRGIGVREWLHVVHPVREPVAAAVFDTRIKGPQLVWGSAAKAISKQLGRLGFRQVVPPQDFLVGGPMGPVFDRLEPGELERARAWGSDLARRVATPVHTA